MPRTSWKPKNPYCRRSKLSKDQFEKLVLCYVMEVTMGITRGDCASFLKKYKPGFDVSRQTVSKYFDKISQRIWDRLILLMDFSDKNKDMIIEELQLLIYGKIDINSLKHKMLYGFLENLPLGTKIEDPNFHIDRTLLIYLLRQRSKRLRGLPKGKFHFEFYRIFFICIIMAGRGVDIKSQRSFYADRTRGKLTHELWIVLLNICTYEPL